jgi:glycosyltransferase involved in cell wall biosynthesis
MKILFDHQIYTNQNYGGISRYFYELAKELTLSGNDCDNSIYFSENEFTKDSQFYHTREFLPFNFRGRASIKEYLNQLVSEQFLKKATYDIFHPTYYDTYFLKSNIKPRPFVITFHDLIHEKFWEKYPDLLTNMDEVISNRKALLQSATSIIAVSNSTKRDIMEYYGVSDDRIQVTHLASSMVASAAGEGTIWGDYILFVGKRLGYKNFDKFIDAVQPLLKREKDVKVVCAGGGPFSREESMLLDKLGITAQVVQVAIDDTHLAKLYSNALFFVFPSLYEGFGIPVLEAFNCRCPTILSNVSSLPEVGGNAALYIDPTDPSDILRKCEMFFYDPGLRANYSEKGATRAKEFSWARTAAQTLNIYEQAITKNSSLPESPNKITPKHDPVKEQRHRGYIVS